MAWWTKKEVAPAPLPRKKRSRTAALQEEADLERAEDAFAVLQEAGQARRDQEVAATFKVVKNPAEYRKAVADIAPAVSNDDKLRLRKLREEYRLKHRKPVQPGEGAAPGPVVASATMKEVG